MIKKETLNHKRHNEEAAQLTRRVKSEQWTFLVAEVDSFVHHEAHQKSK